MKKVILIILFIFIYNITFSQVIIPDNAKETIEIGNTGMGGTSLNKVPNSNYYNFTQQYYNMNSTIIRPVDGKKCKLSFSATKKEIDELYKFLLSKFGTEGKTEIILGKSKILVYYDGFTLHFGNRDCNFGVDYKNKLKQLFGKN